MKNKGVTKFMTLAVIVSAFVGSCFSCIFTAQPAFAAERIQRQASVVYQKDCAALHGAAPSSRETVSRPGVNRTGSCQMLNQWPSFQALTVDPGISFHPSVTGAPIPRRSAPLFAVVTSGRIRGQPFFHKTTASDLVGTIFKRE